MKIEFKKFEEITKVDGWRFRRSPPIGQQWYYDDGFCTNSRGEGFRIHKGTRREDINRLIDALNQRDANIATLSTQAEQSSVS